MGNRWHRVIEAFLPWYDRQAEARRNERTERIRRDAIAARIKAEEVRAAYAAAGRRLQR